MRKLPLYTLFGGVFEFSDDAGGTGDGGKGEHGYGRQGEREKKKKVSYKSLKTPTPNVPPGVLRAKKTEKTKKKPACTLHRDRYVKRTQIKNRKKKPPIQTRRQQSLLKIFQYNRVKVL